MCFRMPAIEQLRTESVETRIVDVWRGSNHDRVAAALGEYA